VLTVSPDGRRLLFSDGSIRDPAGHVIATLDAQFGLGLVWSDGSTHLCGLTTPNISSFAGGVLVGPAVLTYSMPGGDARSLGTVGQFGPNSSVTVSGCSEAKDLAVITGQNASAITQSAKTGLNPTTSLQGIRLSDGFVLWQKTYPVSANPPGGYVTTVSADGRYVAESQRVVGSRFPTAPTVIRDLSSGQVVATLGPVLIKAFSGDDGFVIASTDAGMELIAWRTGLSVRELPGAIAVVAYEPKAAAFMVIEQRPNSSNNELWLVNGDGSSRMVVDNVTTVYGLR
jgi:hypothetical protein